MDIKKTQLIILGVVVFVVIFFTLVFTCVIPGLQSCKEKTNPISGNLEFWGVYDSEAAYDTAFAAFNQIYPSVKISYRRLSSMDEYNRVVLESLATGRGPDIFAISNSELVKHAGKIYPLPKEKLSIISLRQLFPQTVELDFTSQGIIYALPASIDTLALFYNKNLLDQYAVPTPKTWEEFQNAARTITSFEGGKISRAGAAIGGSIKTIPNASDILSLLMLQTGTTMTDASFKNATFASKEGEDALRFYTQFANQRNTSYTWNDTMPNATDAFTQEKVAMIFEYSRAMAVLKERNPFLNYDVAEVPQPAEAKISISYPSYTGFAVSRQSKLPGAAWDFILLLTTNKDTARGYASAAERPPALRSLITEEYISDPKFHVFAKQALTARSWPQIDAEEIKKIFSRAIELVNSNQKDVGSALREARDTITNLMSKKLY